jgi:hypothetical protein
MSKNTIKKEFNINRLLIKLKFLFKKTVKN